MSRQENQENHSNQMNPNNAAFWVSRGYEERPDNWAESDKEKEDKSGGRQSVEIKR